MGVELRPLGVACNIMCTYCYQNPQRDAGDIGASYNMAKMLEALERLNSPFTLFGGEPLLVSIGDLEVLFAWGYQKFGHNTIQTNGTLITEKHIALFKKYRVSVGISIDGDEELNDVRWNGTLLRTRAATRKTMEAIERLCAEGLTPGLIITLHRFNASRRRLPLLLDWLKRLDALGIKSSRLHLLEVDNELQKRLLQLSTEEYVEALITLYRFEKELRSLRFDIFSEMRNLLLALDQKTTCIWNGCDPLTTKAVQGVEWDGSTSNCGRTNKDGIDFLKAEKEGFERYIALYFTPYKYNGCRGCRFFLMCKGQCPGTAIGHDWRNRSEQCPVWMRLFEEIESDMMAEGLAPLSLHPLREVLEKALLNAWMQGTNKNLFSLLFSRELSKSERQMVHDFLQANGITHRWCDETLEHIDHVGKL
jgi:uncharacterized protein